MNEKYQEKEINLLDLLVQFYLFFKKRYVIILASIIILQIYSFTSILKLNSPKAYEAGVKISSNFIREELIDKAIRKIYFGQNNDNEKDPHNLIFSKAIKSKILTVEIPNEDLTKDSTYNLLVSFKKGTSVDTVLEEIINIISNQDSIKEKIVETEKFKKNLLQKTNEKINELETYNKLLVTNLSDKNPNLLGINNYSNKEFFTLMEQKIRLQLNIDKKPITYKIKYLKEISGSSVFVKRTIISLLIGFIVGVFIAFVIETRQLIKARIAGLK